MSLLTQMWKAPLANWTQKHSKRIIIMNHPCVLEYYHAWSRKKIIWQNPTQFYGFGASSFPDYFIGVESPIWHCLFNKFWPAAPIRHLAPEVRFPGDSVSCCIWPVRNISPPWRDNFTDGSFTPLASQPCTYTKCLDLQHGAWLSWQQHTIRLPHYDLNELRSVHD